MASVNTSTADASLTDSDTWPWACLDCETAVYDDRDYCHDCESAHALRNTRRPASSRHAFVDWMRRESYPTFLVKISVVSGTELALTALWLQVILLGPSQLVRATLMFGG